MTNQAQIEALAGGLPALIGAHGFAEGCCLRLDGNEPPWHSTGLALKAGQCYSLFAAGRISWSPRHTELHGGPRFHLWARVSPGGRTVNLTADSGTFPADCDGTLELGIYMGLWADEYGRLASSTDLYRELAGSIDVVATTYNGDAVAVLNRLAREQPAPAAIAAPATAPSTGQITSTGLIS